MKILYYIILVLFCGSCVNKKSESDNVIIINQELNEKIKGKELVFDNLLCINKARIIDSLLILIDRCDSCIFHIYNMKQDSILKSFGIAGQGPNDFIYPLFLNQVNNQDSIFCYDTGLGTLKVINLNGCMGIDSVDVVSRTMPKQLFASPDLSKENFGYMGCMDSGGEGLYFRYLENKDSLIWINYPTSIHEAKGTTGGGSCRLTSNSIKQKVAVSMRYYNKLFLYDYKGCLLKEIQIGEKKIVPIIDAKQKFPKGESLLCSMDIQSTDSFIYVLMQNCTQKDISKPNVTSHILIFDWNLNYIKTYILPHKAHSINVDDKSNKLVYLGNMKNEECVIGIIQL